MASSSWLRPLRQSEILFWFSDTLHILPFFFFYNLNVFICIYINIKLHLYRTSLLVQWLRLHASTVGGMGSIPRWGTKIPHAVWCSQKNHVCILSICFCTLNIFAFCMLISSLSHGFSDHFDCLSSFLAESLGGIHGDFFRYSKVCLQPSWLALSLYEWDILSSLLLSWHIFNILTKYCCWKVWWQFDFIYLISDLAFWGAFDCNQSFPLALVSGDCVFLDCKDKATGKTAFLAFCSRLCSPLSCFPEVKEDDLFLSETLLPSPAFISSAVQ